MNCPHCNQHLANDARFCINCGNSISQEMKGETLIAASAPISTANPPADTARRPETRLSASPANRVIESKYELLERLGEGGMGAVYRARRLRIGDFVAIKILHEKFVTEPNAVERFHREAQAAAMLQHPNIVTIFDYGEEPDKGIPAFIVMELVTGEPLRKILDRERCLPYPRAIAILQSACAGIGAGHRRHIVHRDIKPDNIMVCPPEEEGEGERVKVVDFGIAKLRDMASSNTLTQTGIVMGTPYYMSPEQCRGESLDARSDVYSLGATLYEMLAGKPPFTAATPTGVVAKHLTESPPPLPAELHIPPAIEAIIQRTLAKDPAARQADATALARELQAAISSAPLTPFTVPYQPAPQHTIPVSAQPTAGHSAPTLRRDVTFTQPTPQGVGDLAPSRSKAGLVAGLLVVAVLLAGGGAAYWMLQGSKNENGNNSNSSSGYTSSSNANLQVASTNTSVGPSNSSTTLPDDLANRLPRNESGTVANQNRNESGTPTDGSNVPGTADAAATEQKVVAGVPISKTDIAGLPKQTLRVLRNTVYARHGRIFDTADMRAYFNRQPWYEPRNDYRDTKLTATDRANIEIILAEENRR